MENMMFYKGYNGTVEYSEADGVLFGQIFGINDLVTYEANSIDNLKIFFTEAVESYLTTCKEVGKNPEKEYKGLFNVRVLPRIHKKAAIKAKQNHISLNRFVERAIEKAVED